MQTPVSEPTSPAPSRAKTRSKPKVKAPPDGFYTKLPNEFFKYLMAEDKLIGKTQIYAVLCILRHTWGADGRPEWASLSIDQIAEECGKADRMGMHRVLIDLHERDIIEAEERKGCATKRYRLTPEKWEKARLREATPEPAREKQKPAEPASDKLVVQPGRKPMCVPARMEPKDREPVDFRFELVNTGSLPVEVSPLVEADVVRIVFCSNPPEEAKEKRTLIGLQSYKKKTDSEQNQQLSIFGAAISRILRLELENPFFLDNPLDMALALKTIEKAGPDLPVEVFEAYCHKHYGIMRKKKLRLSPGILPDFAEQAAEEYRKLKLLRELEAKNRPAPPPPPTFTAEELAELAEIEARQALLCERCGGTMQDPTAFRQQNGKKLPVDCTACNGTGRKAGA
jgi:hypothetical protein